MNYAILLSGGTGSRAKTDIPKQYIQTGEHMMITSSLRTLLKCPKIDEVYIVCEEEWQQEILEDVRRSGLDPNGIKGFARPGAVRQTSILNGMEEILRKQDGQGEIATMNDDDTVIVHDAARPFLSEKLLNECYEGIKGHDGVMPVLPMKDTVYRSTNGKTVSELLNRQEIYAGQAPELFIFRKYYEANLKLLPDRILKINGASEPAVLAGMDIAMIPGDERNVKVTTPEDIAKLREERYKGFNLIWK